MKWFEMSRFFDKLCCCCSIKTGGYIVGAFELLNLVAFVWAALDLAEILDEYEPEIVGKGKHEWRYLNWKLLVKIWFSL